MNKPPDNALDPIGAMMGESLSPASAPVSVAEITPEEAAAQRATSAINLSILAVALMCAALAGWFVTSGDPTGWWLALGAALLVALTWLPDSFGG